MVFAIISIFVASTAGSLFLVGLSIEMINDRKGDWSRKYPKLKKSQLTLLAQLEAVNMGVLSGKVDAGKVDFPSLYSVLDVYKEYLHFSSDIIWHLRNALNAENVHAETPRLVAVKDMFIILDDILALAANFPQEYDYNSGGDFKREQWWKEVKQVKKSAEELASSCKNFAEKKTVPIRGSWKNRSSEVSK